MYVCAILDYFVVPQELDEHIYSSLDVNIHIHIYDMYMVFI